MYPPPTPDVLSQTPKMILNTVSTARLIFFSVLIGRGRMEVRAPAAVLHGAERAGGAAAGGVPTRHLQPDDRHRAVDLPLRRAQDTQGVPRHRLHQVSILSQKLWCVYENGTIF